MNDQWQLQDAKSKFSELVNRALSQGAQIVTRHGEKVVVVLPYEQYARLTNPVGNLADFLALSPLAGSEIPLERDQSWPRPLELEP